MTSLRLGCMRVIISVWIDQNNSCIRSWIPCISKMDLRKRDSKSKHTRNCLLFSYFLNFLTLWIEMVPSRIEFNYCFSNFGVIEQRARPWRLKKRKKWRKRTKYSAVTSNWVHSNWFLIRVFVENYFDFHFQSISSSIWSLLKPTKKTIHPKKTNQPSQPNHPKKTSPMLMENLFNMIKSLYIFGNSWISLN